MLKDGFAADERRDEEPHELTEDVAEGNEVEEAYRVDQSFPAQVFLHLAFDRGDVGEQIAMGQAYAARFVCGSRGVDDLDRIICGALFGYG